MLGAATRRENAAFPGTCSHNPPLCVVVKTGQGVYVMEHIQESYRGLSLLMNLNWDRLLYGATIALALGAGAYLGTLLN